MRRNIFARPGGCAALGYRKYKRIGSHGAYRPPARLRTTRSAELGSSNFYTYLPRSVSTVRPDGHKCARLGLVLGYVWTCLLCHNLMPNRFANASTSLDRVFANLSLCKGKFVGAKTQLIYIRGASASASRGLHGKPTRAFPSRALPQVCPTRLIMFEGCHIELPSQVATTSARRCQELAKVGLCFGSCLTGRVLDGYNKHPPPILQHISSKYYQRCVAFPTSSHKPRGKMLYIFEVPSHAGFDILLSDGFLGL